MRELSRTEQIIFLVGATMMVVGSGGNVFGQGWARHVFAIGVIGFVVIQVRHRYLGESITIKRLRLFTMLSDFLFVLSAFMIFVDRGNLLDLPLWIYIKYVHNNWVVVLLLGAILQLYTSHRIGYELEKEGQKKPKIED